MPTLNWLNRNQTLATVPQVPYKVLRVNDNLYR